MFVRKFERMSQNDNSLYLNHSISPIVLGDDVCARPRGLYIPSRRSNPLNLRVASWCLYHKLDWTRPSADPQASGQTSKRISGGCEIRPVFFSSSGLGAILLLQCACTTSPMSVMSPSRPVSQHGLPKYREVSIRLLISSSASISSRDA